VASGDRETDRRREEARTRGFAAPVCLVRGMIGLSYGAVLEVSSTCWKRDQVVAPLQRCRVSYRARFPSEVHRAGLRNLGRNLNYMERTGIEPATPCLQSPHPRQIPRDADPPFGRSLTVRNLSKPFSMDHLLAEVARLLAEP
jgi:hypothetical protein